MLVGPLGLFPLACRKREKAGLLVGPLVHCPVIVDPLLAERSVHTANHRTVTQVDRRTSLGEIFHATRPAELFRIVDDITSLYLRRYDLVVHGVDETLKGDAGTGILDKLDGNVAKNPNASDKTKQEATDADKDVDVNDKPAQTTPSAKNDNAKADSNSGSQPSNAGSSNSGSNNAGNSSKPSQSSQPSKPAHTHTWVNHTATRQVWVSNWVDVPDYGTQQVVVGNTYIFSDGYSTTDINAAKAHGRELAMAGKDCGYQTKPVYENQTVQTGSHKEDHGSYTTESYVDYVYCSSCGARQ